MVSVNSKTYSFVNGTANDATPVDSEFTTLFNNDATVATAVTAIESGAVTLTGVKTFGDGIKTDTISEETTAAGVTIDSVLCKDGAIKFPGSAGYTPSSAGEIGYDSTANTFKAYNGSVITFGPQYPKGYHGSAAPVWVTTTTFTIASIRERNSTNDGDITKDTSTTGDINTAAAGAINGLARSAILTGTVSTTNGSPTVTGSGTSFTSIFQAGDIIATSSGGTRRITTVTSDTEMTAESNFTSTTASQTYRRGGRAPNTWYNIYAATNGTTSGVIISPRNVAGGDTLVDSPTGYTSTRQLPFTIRTDSSSNILPFFVSDGWPYRPRILYELSLGCNSSVESNNVLNAGTATSFTSVSLAAYVPKISTQAIVKAEVGEGNTSVTAYIRRAGETHNGYLFNQLDATGGENSKQIERVFQTDSSQAIEYKLSTGTGAMYIWVSGFIITEVN
jgi:hypothetical protein